MTAAVPVALPADRETAVRLLELLSKFAQAHAKDTFAGTALRALAKRALLQAKEVTDIEALLHHWEEHWPQLSGALVTAATGQMMPAGRVAVTEPAMTTAIKFLDDNKPTEGF